MKAKKDIHIKLSKDLYWKFKRRTIGFKTTMSEVLRECIRTYCERTPPSEDRVEMGEGEIDWESDPYMPDEI